MEQEYQWLNYDFEEAQVKIDLGDMILEQMVEEVIEMLNKKAGGEKGMGEQWWNRGRRLMINYIHFRDFLISSEKNN